MLTFFDYLRQRAFESVLAGAQEALELLESQKNRTEPPKHKPSLPAPRLASQAEPTSEQPKTNAPQENPSQDEDDPLPDPRRRGRPDQRPKERR